MKTAVLFFMLAILFPAFVFAATVDGTPTFSVTVQNSCIFITTPSLSMIYTGLGDATGNFKVDIRCNPGLSWTLSFGGGNNASGGLRRAANGGNYLSYRLYKDAGLTQELQVTANNTISGTGNGTTQATTIYGSVKKADNAGAVSGLVYIDNIIVTCTW